MQLRQIARLDEWYRFDETGPLFITGLQALVRLTLAQSHRDRLAGLDTAGFVSGYRGSPLGGLDRELWRAAPYLDAAKIRFQPGLNEDLAATSIWGTQQANLFPGARHDGVFGMWYGKGPGVDRSGDVFRHANMAGTSPNGGVLVLAATIRRANPRPCPASPNMLSWTCRCPSSTRRTSRKPWTTASSASPCRAIRACGSA